jgi:hypothetical protein
VIFILDLTCFVEISASAVTKYKIKKTGFEGKNIRTGHV